MSVRPRDFLLWATLAAATPALGQTAMPPLWPTVSTIQDAVSIPHLSGRWAHPYLTGFEPPRFGPGPVRNKSRLPNGVANFQRLVGDYTNPILKPDAAAVVKKHGEISLAGEGYPTPSNQCWPPGVPYIFWDFWMEMVQKPDNVLNKRAYLKYSGLRLVWPASLCKWCLQSSRPLCLRLPPVWLHTNN